MIYVIAPAESTVVKIGHTINRPSERLGMLQTGNPTRLVVRWSAEGDKALESHLHAVFKDYRVRGEWFELASFGDPVQAVQDEVRKAADRQAAGGKLLVGDLFRDRVRLSREELSTFTTDQSGWPFRPARKWTPKPSFSSMDDRFPAAG